MSRKAAKTYLCAQGMGTPGVFLLVCMGSMLAGCEYRPTLDRPGHWAQPLAAAGVPNFHQVSPGLLRGGAPSPQGVAALKGMGVRTIVNLCHPAMDGPQGRPEGIDEVRIPMLPWRPEANDVVRFLSLVGGEVPPLGTAAGPRPIFVHCRRGADRTGLMVAMYRICVQNWSKEEALREMTRGGFGFNSTWQGLVTYVEQADVAELKRRAGLDAAPPSPQPEGAQTVAGRNP